LSSAAGGDALYILPILYMLYGFTCGLLSTRFLKKGFWIYTIYEAAVCTVHRGILLLISFLSALAAGESASIVLPLLWNNIFADIIASVIWSLLLYLPMIPIHRLTAGKPEEYEPLLPQSRLSSK
jgi:hypothetical protein